MKRKILLIIYILSCVVLPASAGDDFGLWADVSAGKKITKRLSADADFGVRAEQNVTRIMRWEAGVGVAFKPVKFLKVGAGYTYLRDRRSGAVVAHYNSKGKMNGYNIEHDAWRNKHRLYLDATGSLPIGRFTLSLRERYQYTRIMSVGVVEDKYRGIVSPGYVGKQYGGYAYDETEIDEKSAKDKHYLRSRLAVEYNIRHCPVTPFVSAELSNNLADRLTLDKTRLTAGIDWKVAKQHKLTFAYLWQTGTDDEDADGLHVLKLGYRLNF